MFKLPDKREKVEDYKLLVSMIDQAEHLALYKAVKRFGKPIEPIPPEGIFRMNKGFQFRRTPLPLSLDDTDRLTELCRNRSNFDLSSVESMCGFSEDFCLEWRYGTAVSRMAFCFSCSLVYGEPTRYQTYFGMQKPDRFEAIMRQYL